MVKITLKEKWNYWKEVQEMSFAYEAGVRPREHKLRLGLYITTNVLKSCSYPEFLRRLICKTKGHDWYDEGWATPDSGAIDMVCHRCGKSFQTILY